MNPDSAVAGRAGIELSDIEARYLLEYVEITNREMNQILGSELWMFLGTK